MAGIIVIIRIILKSMHTCICIGTMYVCKPAETKRGCLMMPLSWNSRELLAAQCRCWEPNSGSLEEQQVLLNMDPVNELKNNLIHKKLGQYSTCLQVLFTAFPTFYLLTIKLKRNLSTMILNPLRGLLTIF